MRVQYFRSSSRAKVRALAPWAAVIASAGKGRWCAFESRQEFLESDLGPVPTDRSNNGKERRKSAEVWG